MRVVWALVGALVLAGCAGAEGPATSEPGASESGASDPAGSDPADGVADAGAVADDSPITFHDPVFADLLRTELGLTEITPADLAGFRQVQIAADEFVLLSGNGREPGSLILFNEDEFEYDGQRYTGFGTMTSLADLAHFPDLTSVFVTLQPGIDYATLPVAGLTTVSITQSSLPDVAFLADATELVHLNLSTNDVTDVGPLADCPALVSLSLNWNQVTDLSPLAGLTQLRRLTVYGNGVADLTPLAGLTALEEIGFYGNQITDVSVLAGLPNLTEIELVNNQIADVSPLAGFTSLERLALTGNPVTNIETVGHIATLEF